MQFETDIHAVDMEVRKKAILQPSTVVPWTFNNLYFSTIR